MKCPKCGAYLTMGGEKMDPVASEEEVKRMAWVTRSDVKCWRCGWEMPLSGKPSFRKLNMSDAKNRRRNNAPYQFYARQKRPWEAVERGRKVA